MAKAPWYRRILRRSHALRQEQQGYVREPELPPPVRPELGLWHSGRRDDLAVDNYTRQLTPARLAEALKEAEAGDLSRQAEVFSACETDAHVYAVISKRKRAAASKSMQLLPPSDDARAKAAVELCEQLLAGIENWDEALFDLYDAIGKAFSAAQIAWTTHSGRIAPRQLVWWPQREFVLDEDDPEVLRVLTDGDPSRGEPLSPWQWMVHRYKARSAMLGSASLMRVIVWLYLFKHYSIRDWVIFSEAYGIPRRLAKYPRGADPDELAAIWRAVRSLGKDGAAIVPEGAEIGFLELKQEASSPFEALATFCNQEISKAILGQTLTTEAGDRGARSLGEVHERVEMELLEADCRAMGRTIRRQLLAPIVGFNMGWDVPVPQVVFAIEEDEDLKQRAERDQILGEMGLPISVEYLREKYGIPAPRDAKDTLVVQRAAATAGHELGRLLALAEEKKKGLSWVI